MQVFENILFPVDFSECSDRVCPYALDVAEKFNARLHVLFAVEVIPYIPPDDGGQAVLMDMTSEIVREGENRMEAFCERCLGRFSDYEAKVLIGNPAEKILRYTIEIPIDLIIMGTHGRKGLDRVLMGSVAEQVLKHAFVPALTINPFKPKVQYVHM